MNKYILTKDEVKTLLKITDNNSDDAIDALLPILTAQITTYCKNKFTSGIVTLTSSELTFSASGKTITGVSDDNFEDVYFYADDIILIENSVRNNDYKTIKTVADNVITIADAESLKDEASSYTITISRVDYPDDLKLVISEMVKGGINTQTSGNVSSFSLADYSVSYFDSGLSTSSRSILNLHRKLF